MERAAIGMRQEPLGTFTLLVPRELRTASQEEDAIRRYKSSLLDCSTSDAKRMCSGSLVSSREEEEEEEDGEGEEEGWPNKDGFFALTGALEDEEVVEGAVLVVVFALGAMESVSLPEPQMPFTAGTCVCSTTRGTRLEGSLFARCEEGVVVSVLDSFFSSCSPEAVSLFACRVWSLEATVAVNWEEVDGAEEAKAFCDVWNMRDRLFFDRLSAPEYLFRLLCLFLLSLYFLEKVRPSSSKP
jgi:hypothetical protein